VAALARKHGRPVLAFAGSVSREAALETVFDATCAIIDEPVSLEAAMQRGAEFLERAAERAARLVQLGRRVTDSRIPLSLHD
jgi:glycerate kinase